MQNANKINVKAFCVFHGETRILVFESFEPANNLPIYRPLSGSIEPGETNKLAIFRKTREELCQEIENLKLLGVLENIFTLEGKPGHEVIFVYCGDFIDRSAYEQVSLKVIEDNHDVTLATWKDLNIFDDIHRLVPEGLRELLESAKQNRSSC